MEPGVLGSESGEAADSDDLEAERRAEETIKSWNNLARERQALDKAQHKIARLPNPSKKPDLIKSVFPSHPQESPTKA